MSTNNTYPFDLTPEDLDIIANALSDKPYKVVQPLLEKLRAQFNATMQQRAAAKEEAE